MGKGRRFELELYNDINNNTDDEVDASVADYSGVADTSACDLKVMYPRNTAQPTTMVNGAFIEAKKRKGKGGNRTAVMSGSSQDESGLEELERLIDATPTWGTPYLVIKWTNRRTVVINANDLHDVLLSDNETEAGPPFFDARLTPSDSISMRKPTLDSWKSASASEDDWYALCQGIGMDHRNISLDIDLEIANDD